MIPLGNRVLIAPDPPPTESEGGLALPEARSTFDMSGTVLTVADGPASAQRVRETLLRRLLTTLDGIEARTKPYCVGDAVRETLQAWLRETECLSELRVGDHVAFPYTAGVVIEVDGARRLLLAEDQIVAILDRPEVAA